MRAQSPENSLHSLHWYLRVFVAGANLIVLFLVLVLVLEFPIFDDENEEDSRPDASGCSGWTKTAAPLRPAAFRFRSPERSAQGSLVSTRSSLVRPVGTVMIVFERGPNRRVKPP